MNTLVCSSVVTSAFQIRIDWLLTTGDNSYTQAFVETIQDMFLYQHVYEHTRYRPNTTPHVLDLILTNEENNIMVNDLQIYLVWDK